MKCSITQKNNIKCYKFNDGNIYVHILKDQAELLKLNFINLKYILDYWNFVKDDLFNNNNVRFIFFILKENMNDFNKLVDFYKSLDFKIDYKKLPTSIYFKDDNIYRIISMFSII